MDNAYAKGAEAILVYDNVNQRVPDGYGGITKTDIGSVFISKADGGEAPFPWGSKGHRGPDPVGGQGADHV